VREPLISSTLILDSDEVILETMGDAEAFFGGDAQGALNRPLSEVNPELGRMLKGLLEKAGRGRGVENYALAYRLGKRLVALQVSAIPYPLAALGKTGILVTLVSQEDKATRSSVPPEEREMPLPLPGMAEVREVSREEDLAAAADPLFILDGDGNLAFANLPFQKLLGAGWEELRSSHLSSWMVSAEPRKVVEQIIETVRLVPWRGELELRARDGREVLLNVTFSALKGGKGKAGGFLGCAKDFTELRRLWREKESDKARVAAILRNAPCGLIAFTRDGRVTLWNRAAERLLSVSAERAVGMSLEDFLGTENQEKVRELVERASAGQAEAETVLSLAGAHGLQRLLRLRAAALDRGGREEAECVVTVEDVTELEAAREGAERSDRALGFLSRCAALGLLGGPGEGVPDAFLRELVDFTEAVAGALYGLGEEGAELRSFQGFSEDFAVKAARLRIRTSRLDMLEAKAGEVLDLGESQAPDDTTSLRVLFRDWDAYRQASLEEGHDLQLLLPLKDGDAVVGMLVLAGFPSARLSEEQLLAVLKVLPWLRLAPREEEAGGAALPALDDEAMRRMAHEISSPLTYVRGFAQLLAGEMDQLDPEMMREAIGNLDTGTARLVEIVGHYLPQPPPDE
jgi:PAS domain S-box-containing protein